MNEYLKRGFSQLLISVYASVVASISILAILFAAAVSSGIGGKKGGGATPSSGADRRNLIEVLRTDSAIPYPR